MATKIAQINKRETCYRRMNEFFEFSKSADSSAEAKLMFLHSYSIEVAKITDDFEVSHHKVIQNTEDADFDREDEIRAKFDKIRRQVGLKYFLLAPKPENPAPAAADATSSKIKLPKITLSPFSGDLSLWPSFIALYNRSIHDNPQLAGIEKYQYLLTSLKGEALNVVKGMPLSAEHYTIAYALVKRYQNKRKLASHHWQSIANAKTLKVESPESLRRLVDGFSENLRALELMEFPVDLKDFILLNTLLEKLTPALREKFEVEHRKSEIPKFNQLVDYLLEYCQVLTSLSASGTKAGEKSKDNTKSPSKSASTTSTFVASAALCSICKEAHTVNKCYKFLKLSEKDRYAQAKSLQLCLNCLKDGHRVGKCPSN